MPKKILNWLYVFIWAGLIFFLSHQSGLSSGLPSNWDFVLRKLAHLAEYAVLTYLLFNALNRHQLKNSQIIWLSFLFAFLYAVTDEYHQAFIAFRYGVWTDVLIDSLGILLVGYWMIRKRKSG